ncbi:hypothetical protein PHMEG_0001036 [Phytophthora megakarya]|uniref:Tyr recombinase domain-containing protein n=1 Tax=Phytophthora megakarya TaxID=4795 RepID=A0A225X3R2_9STRA|nr:hypothetical protein PHMEG_0001036 [Phytophthora megakarya]
MLGVRTEATSNQAPVTLWCMCSFGSTTRPQSRGRTDCRRTTPGLKRSFALLGHWELAFHFRFSAVHVAGVENRIADAGSRSSSNRALGRNINVHQVLRPLRAWYQWATRHRIHPALLVYSTEERLQLITDFILHGFQHGFGCGRPVRGSIIVATLQGILHFFHAAGLQFPCDHPQIRMLLRGIARLDAPVRHKAPVSIQVLEHCFGPLNLSTPSDQALWVVVSVILFPATSRFSWFALKAADIAVLDHSGSPTSLASEAMSVHIRLKGSKTNQRGKPTLRMLNRSGHQFLCPVFGAICLLKARHGLPLEIPAAVYINACGRPECVSSLPLAKSIRQAASSLGSNPAEFSAHSLRAGGATHMYRAGIDALTIQFHGRWASDTFKQYTRLCKESVNELATKIVSGSKHMHRLQ